MTTIKGKTAKKTGNLFPFFGGQGDKLHYPKPIGMVHPFYISGAILPCEEYTEWFDTIRNAGPDDVILLHINSGGGDLFTAVQFLRVIQESSAQIVGSVEGACMSAATMIFLACDSFQISEHSMFMFHNYSGGTIGKGGEMYQNILHERKWSENLLHSIYEDFLTKAEITSMLDNQDIWMGGEEVAKRLNAKKDALEAAHNARTTKRVSLKKETTASKTKAKPRTRKTASKAEPQLLTETSLQANG